MEDNQPNEAADPNRSRNFRTLIICATIVATALLYTTRTASFLHLKLFVFACGLAALGIATARGRREGLRATGKLFWIVLSAFSISALVAPSSDRASLRFAPGDAAFVALVEFMLPIFGLLAFASLTREEHRKWICRAIYGAGIVAAILGIAQYAGLVTPLFPRYPGASPIYSVFGNSGLLGGYIAVALPLLLATYLRGKSWQPYHLIALAVLASALLLTGARTAWLACALGCAVSVWNFPSPRAMARVVLTVAVVATTCMLLAPEATVSRAAMSFSAADPGANLRQWFWAGTWEMIKDHPVAGIGMGRYAIESPHYLGEVLWAPGGEGYTHNTLLTEHPHNDFLLLWSELGAIGFALAALLFLRMLRCNGPEWGGLAALFLFGLFNSPLHSPPHAVAGIALGVSLVSRSVPVTEPKTEIDSWCLRLIGVLVAFSPIPIWLYVVQPSCLLEKARNAHVRGEPPLALYADATARPGVLSAAIDEKYAIALLDSGDYGAAKARFSKALRGGDSGALYLGLGTAEYMLGDRAAAYAALEECVRRWPSHFDAWRLLMRVCSENMRVEWLTKAERFLTGTEMKALRAEAAGK